MIKPENDIVIIVELGAGYRDWLVCVMGEDSKRTSRVKPDPANSRGLYVVLICGSFDCCTNT